MNRPVYETVDDISNELSVGKFLKRNWNLTAIHRCPRFYPLDFVLMKNSAAKGLAEIKVRTHEYGRYPTYMISLHKLFEANAMSKAARIPALLVVHWDCGTIGWMDLDQEPDWVGIGGRSDRNDCQDIEPVVHFYIERFNRSIK